MYRQTTSKRTDQTRDGHPRDSKRDGRAKGKAATAQRKAARRAKYTRAGSIESYPMIRRAYLAHFKLALLAALARMGERHHTTNRYL